MEVQRPRYLNQLIDKKGQFLLSADIEVETWWTNLGKSDHEIIKLYHAHGECEQYHSEVKSDKDVERLPSGKFNFLTCLCLFNEKNGIFICWFK